MKKPPAGQSRRCSTVPSSVAKAVQPLGPKQFRLIRSAYDALAPEGGWVTLAALGGQILKLSPSFDPRTYGFQKLSGLIAAMDNFKVDNRTADGKGGEKHLYVTLNS